jgi:hypothetical protein
MPLIPGMKRADYQRQAKGDRMARHMSSDVVGPRQEGDSDKDADGVDLRQHTLEPVRLVAGWRRVVRRRGMRRGTARR